MYSDYIRTFAGEAFLRPLRYTRNPRNRELCKFGEKANNLFYSFYLSVDGLEASVVEKGSSINPTWYEWLA